MSGILLRGLARLFLVLALSCTYLGQQTATLTLLLGESCKLLTSGEGQNLQEGLSGGQWRHSHGTGQSQPQTQQPNKKADEVTCLPRVVFSPPGWTLISSRQLLR